jgi:hypothetical protein
MSLADPLSVTVNGTAYSLPKVDFGSRKGTYQDPTGVSTVNVSHTIGKRTRRLIRFDFTKVSADPFLPDTNAERGMSVYTVIDVPKYGFSIAEQKFVYDGFKTLLGASSDAVVVKLLNGES